ncbi:MAG: TIGR03936 family radical SAM-associated protein [Clostridia bacterium]|nr:TIGR03936 family radical SAM-associated protein [Clostridia bacterium]
MRVRFDKAGRAKYFSHLDLNRCMQRALRRAGLPVWYTQGFNPHPYITFALPLSLGCESECELMDIRLEDEATAPMPELAALLASQLPEGITVTDVWEPVMKACDLGFARYRLEYTFEAMSAGLLRSRMQSLLAQPEIAVTKETKHAVRRMELKKWLEQALISVKEDCLTIELTLPAGSSESIGPVCVDAALAQTGLSPLFCRARRLELYNLEMKRFR